MASDKPDAVRIGHFCQIALCLYGARFSYVAIRNLRSYENITKKAAKYSKDVERQLQLTRMTQTTGALCLLASFIAATLLLTTAHHFPRWLRYAFPPTLLIVTMGSRAYIKSYWAPYKDSSGKDVGTRVPMPYMEEYNEAEVMTERLLEVLQYLEYSWVAASFFTGLVGV